MKTHESLVGYTNGRIQIIARVLVAKTPILWWYKCSCGKYGIGTKRDLKRTNKVVEKSCGCANREHAKKLAEKINAIDLTGKQFGRWHVLKLQKNRLSRHRLWLCRCTCGTERAVISESLLQNRSTSCGCYQKEIAPLLALHMSKARRSNKNLVDRSRPAITNTLRYSRQRDATPVWVSRTELRRIYNNCPEGYHVDHIHPLKHPRLCGLHVPWNLQYLPAKINLSKGNRLEP